MRVMIAPDSFGETLTATAAADAIARGWSSVRPSDEVILAPQSDGGPGFVGVLATRMGVVRTVDVEGPLGAPVTAQWLLDGTVAYIEAAQACGLGLLGGKPTTLTALKATSYGVGQIVAEALDAGAQTLYVGLGGSSCTDGGRGMVRALGGLGPAAQRLRGIDLIAATDVDNELLGPLGAASVFGPQKGADAALVLRLDELNADWAGVLHVVAGIDVARMPGAGAAGGIGAALFALGGRRESGATVVAERTGQAELLRGADLVITGEGKFDEQSVRGKLVSALAAAGTRDGTPTIVLAGQVTLSVEDAAAAGIFRAYSMADSAGSVALAMSDASNQLEILTSHAAVELAATPALVREE